MQPEKRHSKGPFKPLVIIHGGAGSITRPNLPPSLYNQYHASLKSYLQSTYAILNGGDPSNRCSGPVEGSIDKHDFINNNNAFHAVDAATHAVSLLEEDPLFNCGHGSVFNTEGEIQMEASIAVSSIYSQIPTSIPGHVKKSAAVSMVTQTRHPILLAKEILNMGDDDQSTCPDDERVLGNVRSMHGHLSGEWVEQYGWSKGLEKKPKQWFWTRKRWDEHRRGLGLDHSDEAWNSKLNGGQTQASKTFGTPDSSNADVTSFMVNQLEAQVLAHDLPSQGTVGAVCLDTWGNLAVATSTGGLTNKRPGRIGDTPTVGAGFWAESWDETTNVTLVDHVDSSSPTTFHLGSSTNPIQAFLNLTRQESLSWLNDCLPIPALFPYPRVTELRSRPYSYHQIPISSLHQHQSSCEPHSLIKTQPSPLPCLTPHPPSSHFRSRTAIALSGTGNGDSFLRTSAARTAAAIARFSPSPAFTSSSSSHHPSSHSSNQASNLARALTQTSGPNGLLQKSAESRWGTTAGAGEGEGGIIGIEARYTYARLPLSAPNASNQQEAETKREEGGENHQHINLEATIAFDFNCGGMWRAYREEDGKGGWEDKVMVFKEEY